MKLFEAAKSVNIVDVYNKLSATPAKKTPKGGSGHCPFHDDTHPSLALYTDKNTFTCHCGSCGAHGSAIDLTMQMLGMDNKSAAEWICKTFGVTISQFLAENDDPFVVTKEQRKLLERWAHLTPEQQEVIFKLIDIM